MNSKKNVKLLVFILVLALAVVMAFGMLPSGDTKGNLHTVVAPLHTQQLAPPPPMLNGFTATDDPGDFTATDDSGYTATDDFGAMKNGFQMPTKLRSNFTQTDDFMR